MKNGVSEISIMFVYYYKMESFNPIKNNTNNNKTPKNTMSKKMKKFQRKPQKVQKKDQKRIQKKNKRHYQICYSCNELQKLFGKSPLNIKIKIASYVYGINIPKIYFSTLISVNDKYKRNDHLNFLTYSIYGKAEEIPLKTIPPKKKLICYTYEELKRIFMGSPSVIKTIIASYVFNTDIPNIYFSKFISKEETHKRNEHLNYLTYKMCNKLINGKFPLETDLLKYIWSKKYRFRLPPIITFEIIKYLLESHDLSEFQYSNDINNFNKLIVKKLTKGYKSEQLIYYSKARTGKSKIGGSGRHKYNNSYSDDSEESEKKRKIEEIETNCYLRDIELEEEDELDPFKHNTQDDDQWVEYEYYDESNYQNDEPEPYNISYKSGYYDGYRDGGQY